MAGTDQPIVAQGIVTTGPDSEMPYAWRRGPDTPDGYWAVTTTRAQPWAVRVIVDPYAARDYDMYRLLEAALQAPRYAREDAYLSAVTVVSTLPPSEIERLRDAVTKGHVGGAADGHTSTPRRRTARTAPAR